MTLKKSDGLEEWAARTALTLDDDTWSVLLRGSTVEWGPGKGDALLAVLDRIAGELTKDERYALEDACDEEGAFPDGCERILTAGLVRPRDGDNWPRITPLGRAVLARTEGRR